MALLDNSQISGITGGLGLIGIAGSIMGSMESAEGAKAKAAAEKQIAQLEIQADSVRRQAMEMSARRQQLQTVRNAQQAQAQALSNAVNQGAQFSSSASAGQGAVSAQAASANLGVSQSVQFGENIFDINAKVDQQKIAEADAETKMYSGQGMSSLFGDLTKAAPGIGNLLSLVPMV